MYKKPLARIMILCFLLAFSFSIVSAQDVTIPNGQKILAWVGDGQSAGAVGASNPGELVYIDSSENFTTVMSLPQGTSRVIPCGEDALSPDGRQFAFYVGTGNELGTLYVINGTGQPEIVAEDLYGMACAGGGTFQYKPDSSQFAYMDNLPESSRGTYPEGYLTIVNASDLSVIDSFEQVTAFDVTNDYYAFVSLYTNNKEEAVEAAITTFDGNTDREVATLFADDDCQFTNGNVSIINSESMVVVMGQRCKNQSTNTLFYTIDTTSRSATLAMTVPPVGSYVVASRTNQIVPSTDDSTVFITIPDGVTNYTTGISSVVLESMTYNTIYDRNAVMSRYTSIQSYTENKTPVFSSDGTWWAMALKTPNNEPSVAVFDLESPELAPIEISGGSSGDIITDMMFTPDNKQLVYVAGGHSSNNNSLFGVDLETGNDFRIRRGRYGEAVISPDSDKVALINWEIYAEDEPAYQTFVLVDIASSNETVKYVGAEIIEEKVENMTFVYPIAWLRD